MTAGRTVNAQSKDWCTPAKYVQSVREVFGGRIDLDPCSNEWSIVKAKTEWRLPTDGLRRPWKAKTIYVNPPYGADRERGTRISDWLRKCAEAFEAGSEVIALVPVAANTKHWKDSVWSAASAVCFLYDTRLRFLEFGNDKGKGAPMACAAVYWGGDVRAFGDAFEQHGAVVDLSSVRIPKPGSRQLGLLDELKLPSDKRLNGRAPARTAAAKGTEAAEYVAEVEEWKRSRGFSERSEQQSTTARTRKTAGSKG